MYSNYSRSGGCTSCGVAPRTVGRDQFSRTNYDSFNVYPSNNYYNRNYNFDNYSNNISQSYVNNSRRIMTPTKNYASEYSSIIILQIEIVVGAENVLLVVLPN